MNMAFLGLTSWIIVFSPPLFALEKTEIITKDLFQKNQEVAELEKNIEAHESNIQSSRSTYYPTLNIIGGWGRNKTDDLAVEEKGYFGYAEGRLNLFRGFKDQSFENQKNIDLKIARLNLEYKKKELIFQFNEIVSEMIYLHKVQIILDEEYKTTQIQKQMAAKKVAAGLTGSIDNLEFNLRENEIEIEQKQIQQLHFEAHQRLLKLFGDQIPDAVIQEIDFSSIEIFKKIPSDLNIDNSIAMQKAQLANQHSLYELNEVKSEYLPSLDFTYSFGRLIPNENSTLSMNESKYALQITIPLFSGFDTYYKTKSAQANKSAIEKMANQKKIDLTSEFNILKNKIDELYFLYLINEKKIMSSQKYFDLTLSEYKRGVKNSPDIVTASERLYSSKKKKNEILKDLEIAKAKIETL